MFHACNITSNLLIFQERLQHSLHAALLYCYLISINLYEPACKSGIKNKMFSFTRCQNELDNQTFRTRTLYQMQLWTDLFHVQVEYSRLLHSLNVWQAWVQVRRILSERVRWNWLSVAVDTDLFAQPTLGLWTQGHRRMYGKHRGERWWSLLFMVLYIRPWRTSFETRSKELPNNLLGANSLSILKYLAICVNRIFFPVETKDSHQALFRVWRIQPNPSHRPPLRFTLII